MLRSLAVVLGVAALAAGVLAQSNFVDDAGRAVVLPARPSRVFAAGAPADMLLYTLAPELLVGRNRVPSGEALEFVPPAYRNPRLIRQLPEVDNPAADAELIALKPEVYVDYGTVAPDYIESLEAVQRRTGVPGIILDGALARVPDAYRRLGAALGISERGQRLGDAAARLLNKYRGALARGSAPVRVYLACSADGYMPCLADESGGEQLQWLGGVNVAGTRASGPRRPLTIDEIKALSPDVIVISGSVARLRSDSAWQVVDAVKAGRVYAWPTLPDGWGSRPPSVNRLPGIAWLVYVASGRRLDSEFEADVRAFFRDFYHLDLTGAQMRKLLQAS
ncbi:MAG: ABC transporter substrate-binding protein [Acidobacteria bacterium]|nr:ABC transporter substrate-binding protein [Acidobacteriota bacterium]